MIRFILIILCFSSALGQSLEGTNGLFKIPSAYVAPDGQSYIGASFYPKESYELYSSGDRFTGMPTFVTLSLYDRIEFMFRYTHQLGQEVNPQTQYFPDRMFTLRYNALKEAKNFPAITIGLHDVSEALGGTTATPWFLTTYIVASKTIETNSLNIAPTFGYAYDIFGSSRPMVFDGFFGGLEISSKKLPFISAIVEHDSEVFNVALKSTVFDHLHFALGFLDMKALSGFFTYRFNLSNR